MGAGAPSAAAGRFPDRRRPVPRRLLRWCANALYGALTVLLLPYALWRLLREPKTRARWRAYVKDVPARFGRRQARVGSRPCLWVHGVSVGEVKAAAQMVRQLEAGRPSLEVVFSVTTDTARRVASDLYPGHRIEYYPPDLSWLVRDALAAVRPDVILLLESEFWPNFLLGAHERRTPVALVNGRLSEASARRFGWARALSQPMLSTLSLVCTQMPEYAQRFVGLGLDPARVHVTGNMKLDNIPVRRSGLLADAFRAVLGLAPGLPLLVGGSTHPGEELALARIAGRLAAQGCPVLLLVAPRHPGRADDVERELLRAGVEVARRSRLPGATPPAAQAVRLLDTVGELERAYALADLVFVGGTLVRHGGQNMMEPASLGRPVVVGPYVHNFRGEVDMLRAADGIVVAPDEDGVFATLLGWLREPARAQALGERGRQVLEANKGATERTLAVLEPLLARALGPPTRLSGEPGA